MPRTIAVRTSARAQFIDITGKIQKIVEESGIGGGICHIYVPHTTAGVTINEHADPDVATDMQNALERLVPWRAGYAHTEGNSAAHIKAGLLGFSQSVLIEEGKLLLGTWQGIFFAEFDGPRQREVWVSVVP